MDDDAYLNGASQYVPTAAPSPYPWPQKTRDVSMIVGWAISLGDRLFIGIGGGSRGSGSGGGSGAAAAAEAAATAEAAVP